MDSISIIIPSYNHKRYIRETIQSIVDQKFNGPINLIIIDDASTDATQEYLKSIDNKKIKNTSIQVLIKSENRGVNDSIEIGLSYVNTKWVQLLASDDLLIPDKLSKQLSYVQRNDCDAVYSRGYILDGTGVKTEYKLEDFKHAYENNYSYKYISTQDWGGPLLQSAILKTTTLKKLCHLRRRYQSDDWVTLIALLRDYKVEYLDEPLIIYRQHENNSYKKYLKTFPMRLDVALNFVDETLRDKTIGNLFASQSQYYYYDGLRNQAIRYAFISMLFKIRKINFIWFLFCLLPYRYAKLVKSMRSLYKKS